MACWGTGVIIQPPNYWKFPVGVHSIRPFFSHHKKNWYPSPVRPPLPHANVALIKKPEQTKCRHASQCDSTSSLLHIHLDSLRYRRAHCFVLLHMTYDSWKKERTTFVARQTYCLWVLIIVHSALEMAFSLGLKNSLLAHDADSSNKFWWIQTPSPRFFEVTTSTARSFWHSRLDTLIAQVLVYCAWVENHRVNSLVDVLLRIHSYLKWRLGVFFNKIL